MKSSCTIIFALVICLALVSCKHQDDLDKRRYTDGHYHDFNFHREKTDKEKPLDSLQTEVEHPVLTKMKKEFLPSLSDVKTIMQNPDPTEVLNEQHPMVAAKMDSLIARQMQKDSTWRTDTIPEAIATALSSQAMIGVGTVGGLITIAEPAAIWFTFIPMIGIPFFLLISLIAAAVASAKISRGEIDAKYKKWMRLWAVCLLVNILLGSIVLLHFTAL